MSVRCEHCGEELIGAVNRCWRCGHQFATPLVARDTPTAREAESATRSDDVGAAPGAGAGAEEDRSGGPAADPQAVVGADRSAPSMADAPGYPRHVAAFGGALAALVLSVFALAVGALSDVPVIGVFLALFGLLLGSWGLLGPRRNWAAVGLALCLLALGLSGVRSAIQLHGVLSGEGASRAVEQDLSPAERQQLGLD